MLLSDKNIELTEELIEKEHIGYILAILPYKSDFDKHYSLIKHLDIPYSVMDYGDSHYPIFDEKMIGDFNRESAVIDQFARSHDRKNVLVFCNNGYQRSIPFLTYFLTQYHKDEYPDIDTALNMILIQSDKLNFNTNKPLYLESISSIFRNSNLLDNNIRL